MHMVVTAEVPTSARQGYSGDCREWRYSVSINQNDELETANFMVYKN